MNETNAKSEILELLAHDEAIEAVVIGEYGWSGYGEEALPCPIPQDMRNKVLSWEEAAPHMECWSCYGGYGSPSCYAMYVYTNMRIFFIRTYDGSTSLSHIPRNPVDCSPDMFGGG